MAPRSIVRKGLNPILELFAVISESRISKNVMFDVSISAETENISFAKNKLLQITGNLISNAIKFTAGGGYVKVDLA